MIDLMVQPFLSIMADTETTKIYALIFSGAAFVLLLFVIYLLVKSFKEQKAYDTFSLPSIPGIGDDEPIEIRKEVIQQVGEDVSAFTLDDDGDDDVFNDKTGFKKDDFFDVKNELPRFSLRSKKK